MPPIGDDRMTSGKPIRSVFLVRHGIRSPKDSDTALGQWSTSAWPTWPGKPGDLTERGKELIRAQWSALKPFLVRNGLVPENGLPKAGDYALIADKDQRTRMSAIALFDGLFPGCHIRPQYGSRYDLLFHPDSSMYRAMDRQKALAEVQALLDPLDFDPVIGNALNLLQDITKCCRPSLCGALGGTSSCTLQGLPNRMSIDPRKPRLDIEGKWHIASTLAEIMLLEFAQWPEKEAGWGEVDARVLRQIIPVHNAVFNATHRAQSLAKAGGIHMLEYIHQTLLSEKSPPLTILVGHDTNIAYVSGLLDIHWSVPELGNDPVIPGSFLTFELWQKAGTGREIRAGFHAPSLDFLRTSPASLTSPVSIPVDKAVYEPDTFKKQVENVTALEEGLPVTGKLQGKTDETADCRRDRSNRASRS